MTLFGGDAGTATLLLLLAQGLWGLLLLLLGIVLKGMRADMASYAADIKQLSATVLGQCIQRPFCEAQVREKWEAIDKMREKVGRLEVAVSALEAKAKP